MTTATFGVDVSKWQEPPLNWEGMRDNKHLEFMVARASLGTVADLTFHKHVGQAAKAGFATGAYHYQWPGIAPRMAVQLLLEMLGPLAGQAVALDVEEKGVSWSMVKAWAREWDRQSKGYPLGIYISRGYWVRIGKPRLSDYFEYLWLAYWPYGGYPGDSDPTWDRRMGGLKPTVWQYGVRRASGKKLDGNAFRGTIDDYLRKLTELPTPPDTSTGAPMTLEIESTDPVIVHAPEGTQAYDLAGNPLRTLANDRDRYSPYGVTDGSRHYRLVDVGVKGANVLGLLRLNAITTDPVPAPTDDTPYSQEDLDAAVEDAIKADRAKATVGIIYQEETP